MSETVDSVLLADVGGTNVRFALADPARAAPLGAESIRRYRVADFATFSDSASTYLGALGARPRHGVFAFAGQIRGGEVEVTNHTWTVSRERMRVDLHLDSLHFVNDFAAMSLSVPLLGAKDLAAIGDMPPPLLDAGHAQTFAVIGPGTGLGVGALLVRGGVTSALETEGGHASFAPRTDEEIEVLRVLTARFGRVSHERLLCGSGLANLHEALGRVHGTFEERLPPEEITRRADAGIDAGCVRAVEAFCELLGAVAGDFVLSFGAWDGAYLAGGLTPLLLPWLKKGGFRRRFADKGRFADALARIPSIAILHPDAGLLGAAAYAVSDSGRALVRAAGSSR